MEKFHAQKYHMGAIVQMWNLSKLILYAVTTLKMFHKYLMGPLKWLDSTDKRFCVSIMWSVTVYKYLLIKSSRREKYIACFMPYAYNNNYNCKAQQSELERPLHHQVYY